MSMGLGVMAAGLLVLALAGLAASASKAGASSSAPAGTGGTPGAPGGGTGSLPKNADKLNANQRAFAARLQADTGLDPAVIAGWLLSEEPASASQAPNGANNWLNIGAFDAGGWAGGGANVWSDPIKAADATASFLTGASVNGISSPLHPAPGILNIVKAAGQGIDAQIAAIQSSGWASGGYPDLAGVIAQFR